MSNDHNTQVYILETPCGKITASEDDLVKAMELLDKVVNARRHNDPHHEAIMLERSTQFIDNLKSY